MAYRRLLKRWHWDVDGDEVDDVDRGQWVVVMCELQSGEKGRRRAGGLMAMVGDFAEGGLI